MQGICTSCYQGLHITGGGGEPFNVSALCKYIAGVRRVSNLPWACSCVIVDGTIAGESEQDASVLGLLAPFV